MFLKRAIHGFLLSLLFLLSLFSTGCPKSTPDHENSDVGIYVDRPEVFKRERFIRRRIETQSWIKGKIETLEKEDYTPSYSALMEFNVLDTIITKLSARLDPFLSTPESRGLSSEMSQMDHEEKIAKIDREIELLKKVKELKETRLALLEEPSNVISSSSPTQSDSGDGNSRDSDTVNSNNVTPDAAAGLSSEVLKLLNDDTIKTLLKSSGSTNNDPSLSEYDKYREQKSIRDLLYADLSEVELDDTHDLRGLTFYTLKFDVSILPEEDTDDLAVVELTIETDSTSNVSNENQSNASNNVRISRTTTTSRSQTIVESIVDIGPNPNLNNKHNDAAEKKCKQGPSPSRTINIDLIQAKRILDEIKHKIITEMIEIEQINYNKLNSKYKANLILNLSSLRQKLIKDKSNRESSGAANKDDNIEEAQTEETDTSENAKQDTDSDKINMRQAIDDLRDVISREETYAVLESLATVYPLTHSEADSGQSNNGSTSKTQNVTDYNIKIIDIILNILNENDRFDDVYTTTVRRLLKRSIVIKYNTIINAKLKLNNNRDFFIFQDNIETGNPVDIQVNNEKYLWIS